MTKKSAIAAVLLAVFHQSVGAYELATHAAISLQAVARSDLGISNSLLEQLGILIPVVDPQISSNPFGVYYYDVSGSRSALRLSQKFETKVTSSILGLDGNRLIGDRLDLPGWVMRGAVREDDGGYLLGTLYRMGVDGEPYDDPYENINRWCNHFFDPLHASPTSEGAATFPCPIELKESAPNWAIGTEHAFQFPINENRSRRNHFSVADAREAMYRALTGLNKDGMPVGAGETFADQASFFRDAYWATTFRALGDVVHLVQDMAQPQHARDESHGGLLRRAGLDRGGPSSLERYIDARAMRATAYAIDGVTADISAGLNFIGYPIPAFQSYSDFWSTGLGDASLTGKGLADYANHGFLTFGNNIGGTKFPSPPTIVSAYLQVPTTYPPSMANAFSMRYLAAPVVDKYIGTTSSPVRMIKESAWKAFSTRPIYTVDRHTFDDMAELLVPRAVSYSAGLINHFFRGRLEISLPDEAVYGVADHSAIPDFDPARDFKGFDRIRLKLAKVAPTDESMFDGSLRAVLKFRRNICFARDLTGFPPLVDWASCRSAEEEIVVSDSISTQGEIVLTEIPQPLTFKFQTQLPINATDVRLQVVYRGRLGTEEDAVVVATKDIAEPTFFTYQNTSDYILIANKVYTRAEVNASIALLAKVQPQSLVDYTQSPPRLKLASLQPFPLSLDLSFDPQRRTSVRVDNLQPGEFIRLAILGDARLPATAPAQNMTVITDSVRYCLPNRFEITPMNWQLTYESDSNALITHYPEFSKVRGIPAWAYESCVANGDGSEPGSTDDRATKMVAAPYDNPQPIPVLINGGIGF